MPTSHLTSHIRSWRQTFHWPIQGEAHSGCYLNPAAEVSICLWHYLRCLREPEVYKWFFCLPLLILDLTCLQTELLFDYTALCPKGSLPLPPSREKERKSPAPSLHFNFQSDLMHKRSWSWGQNCCGYNEVAPWWKGGTIQVQTPSLRVVNETLVH